MFTAEERKEYGFGSFEEDLKATNDECYGKGDMAWEDLEKCALLQQKYRPRPRWPAQDLAVCCVPSLAGADLTPVLYSRYTCAARRFLADNL